MYQQQSYAPQPQYMAVPVMQVEEPGSGQALTGMILGIISLFFPILSIPGLIFSIIGLKSISRKGMAIAGLITSIIAILYMIFLIILFIGIIAAASTAGSSGY
jgi:hypothetical protein